MEIWNGVSLAHHRRECIGATGGIWHGKRGSEEGIGGGMEVSRAVFAEIVE
jgi:hypothetical protein